MTTALSDLKIGMFLCPARARILVEEAGLRLHRPHQIRWCESERCQLFDGNCGVNSRLIGDGAAFPLTTPGSVLATLETVNDGNNTKLPSM